MLLNHCAKFHYLTLGIFRIIIKIMWINLYGTPCTGGDWRINDVHKIRVYTVVSDRRNFAALPRL